jgi:hypothetical protein
VIAYGDFLSDKHNENRVYSSGRYNYFYFLRTEIDQIMAKWATESIRNLMKLTDDTSDTRFYRFLYTINGHLRHYIDAPVSQSGYNNIKLHDDIFDTYHNFRLTGNDEINEQLLSIKNARHYSGRKMGIVFNLFPAIFYRYFVHVANETNRNMDIEYTKFINDAIASLDKSAMSYMNQTSSSR